MNTQARQEDAGDPYLGAALAWLRLRLYRLGEPLPVHKEGRLRSTPVAEPTTEEAVQAAAVAMRDTEKICPSSPLLLLSRLFGLSLFEREVLLLCAAVELDPFIAGLCGRVYDNPQQAYPTFALARALFVEPEWSVLSPQRPLRYWHLLEINQYGHQPLTTSPLRADERIVNYLNGVNYLDDRLGRVMSHLTIHSPTKHMPPSHQMTVEAIIEQLRQAGESLPVIHLVGADEASKRFVAWHAAHAIDHQLYRLIAESLATLAGELETLARLYRRESRMIKVAVYIDAHDLGGVGGSDGPSQVVRRFLERTDGSLAFLTTREPWPDLRRSGLVFDVTKPSPTEQEGLWNAVLGENSGALPAELAGNFNLGVSLIHQVAGQVPPETPAEHLQERLWHLCMHATRPRLDALAQRLVPRAQLDDLVLPSAQKDLLRHLIAQVRQRRKVYEDWAFSAKMSRGLGISVLFAGESGVGKTMAAEVIAKELKLDLFRIDLSGVINKFIGETEKNLRYLFDAAEDGGAILFFDEADSLFGKRSEVKDSHDRYANIEINYLLQRMEAYRGLAILATNMKNAMDQAFLRRLRFVFNFAFPDAPQRKEIWTKVFPENTPRKGLDYDWLARLTVTGGSISNIALHAAFLAAQDDAEVTMPLILKAARQEFAKLERPVREADFLWREPQGVSA